jgi:murein hydrolase activator
VKHAFLLLAALGALGAGAFAQGAADPIARAQQEAQAALESADQLEKKAAEAGNEAERTHMRAEALVARIEASEAVISTAEMRIGAIDALRREQQAKLADKQEPLLRLTGALQILSRRPAALSLVQPGSLDEAVRVRALFASTLPAVQERTAALRSELAASMALRRDAESAAKVLKQRQARLREQSLALAQLEEERRRNSQDFAAAAMLEQDRALALNEEARQLVSEAARKEREARAAARLAALPAPLPRPFVPEEDSRRQPLAYRVPVEGRVVTGTGEISPAGVHARGITFAARAGAEVEAPASGRIVYAGRFRSYGEIVIIDHGRGWTSTLTGLSSIQVKRGESVRMGEPVGLAGGQVTVELRQGEQPYPIASLLTFGRR